MNCTSLLGNNDPCPHEATRIIAFPMLGGTAVFVAPYCKEHAERIQAEEGGVFACGPALAPEAASIEGVRRG